MPDVLSFAAVGNADAPRVGGKGFALARMAAAGLPVPPGFVVTTDAYRRLHPAGTRSDPAFARAVLDAYQELGGGPVAVRSSATGEDGPAASFAGQQESVLGVEGSDAVLAAVERCWHSLHTARAVAYRRDQGVADAAVAMAVVVQAMVPADVAGVLFTRDPTDPAGGRMLAEASWGLGEAVVSGRVTPDRFRLDRDTGAVVDRTPGRKTVRATAAGEEPVPPDRQAAFCLSDDELSQLVALGREVERFAGGPRDVEWAFAAGRFAVLQARPITAAGRDREAVRAAVIAELTAKADPRGTVWARYSLGEILPEPTPMTWAVVRRLVAADGGVGAMNRDLGARPDPALGGEGAFDLVAGRPMANLSRMPRLQFARPPFEYPFAALKADPRLAFDPQPVLDPLVGGVLGLPGLVWRLWRMSAATRREAETFADRFRGQIAPAFAAAAKAALARDWTALKDADLEAAVHDWTRRTLVDFARDSLKPTVFAGLAWQTLADALTPRLGPERARAAVGELALGAEQDDGTDYAAAVQAAAAGRLGRAAFLDRFGHRAANEMELAQPRWVEDPAAVDRLLAPGAAAALTPAARRAETVARVAAEAGLAGPARDRFVRDADRLRTYLGLRESAKHYLLMGYAVIRRALVELDRRAALGGGIFFLTPDELTDLRAGADVAARIADRRKRRRVELSLPVPPVLFSDDLEAIGRPVPVPVGTAVLDGVPLSAGVAEGPALVLADPAVPPGVDDGFVLVCPSTDPAWVPLFARARGLVMETGGVLSHGAIVAREFGLPAVAGLPGVSRRLRTGQPVRVDGGTGQVVVVG